MKGTVVVERRPAEEIRTRADRSERGRWRARRGEGRRQRLRGSGTCGCSPARAAAPLRRRGSLPCSCGCSPARLGYHAAAAAARSPVSGMEVSAVRRLLQLSLPCAAAPGRRAAEPRNSPGTRRCCCLRAWRRRAQSPEAFPRRLCLVWVLNAHRGGRHSADTARPHCSRLDGGCGFFFPW